LIIYLLDVIIYKNNKIATIIYKILPNNMNLLDNLNKEQKKAVLGQENNILVLAGAGTGKTTTLAKRIARLIMDGVDPMQIMAVTFTNKASKEIRERVASVLPTNENIHDLLIGTFHGICNRMIRANYSELGLSPSYQIIDANEQKDIIKKIVKNNNEILEIDGSLEIKDSHIVNLSLSKISRMKEDGVSWENAKNPPDVDWNLVAIFKLYETIKNASGFLDFTDLLIYGVKLLENKKIGEHYSDLYEYLLVDEFQDTNKLQMRWIKLLNPENLFVVGDDDQSIYKFRGAEIKNILGFVDNYKGAKIISLEQNYRSTPEILSVANAIIDYNEFRHYKELWTDNESGDIVKVMKCVSGNDESKKVIKRISKLLSQGEDPSEIAIIYRANHLSRLFEKPLMREGIGYQITGGIGFWQRKEIKDVLSYFAIIMNNKNHIALERSLKYPSRGIGQKTIEKIINFAEEESITYFDAIDKMTENGKITGKGKKTIIDYMNIIRACDDMGIADTLKTIIDGVDVNQIYKHEDDKERLDNINELLAAGIEAEDDGISKEDFLSNASLLGSIDDKSREGKNINLTTVHSAKGLEFKYVFLVGMEDGTFPSNRSLGSQEDIEEERRLCYVGATRAKKELVMSHAMTRTAGGSFNKPCYKSRFLAEIPDKLIKKVKSV
jgi:DNA helicase-2/ATP-dependent DNA helicase PcrA